MIINRKIKLMVTIKQIFFRFTAYKPFQKLDYNHYRIYID